MSANFFAYNNPKEKQSNLHKQKPFLYILIDIICVYSRVARIKWAVCYYCIRCEPLDHHAHNILISKNVDERHYFNIIHTQKIIIRRSPLLQANKMCAVA